MTRSSRLRLFVLDEKPRPPLAVSDRPDRNRPIDRIDGLRPAVASPNLDDRIAPPSIPADSLAIGDVETAHSCIIRFQRLRCVLFPFGDLLVLFFIEIHRGKQPDHPLRTSESDRCQL